MAVTIVPKIGGSSDISPYAYRDTLISTLRHAQYQAMADRSLGACYQVHVESKRFGYNYESLGSCDPTLVAGASFAPFEVEGNTTPNQTDLGAVIDEDDISITATDLNGNNILNLDVRFNGLGQPSWLNGAVEESGCSQGCQININTLPVCIGEQGYIRAGAC